MEVPTQEPESEAEGCPSEQEVRKTMSPSRHQRRRTLSVGNPSRTFYLSLNEDPWQQDSRVWTWWDLERVFEVRALVMKSVPGFMKGAFRGAMKISLEEIKKGQLASNVEIVCVAAEDVVLQTTPIAQSGKRRRGGQNDVENRAARALHLAQMGELSSVRQALEAVAPGNEATRAKLMNESRRPSAVRRGVDEDGRTIRDDSGASESSFGQSFMHESLG